MKVRADSPAVDELIGRFNKASVAKSPGRRLLSNDIGQSLQPVVTL